MAYGLIVYGPPTLEGKGWIGRPEVLGLNYGVIALPFLSHAIRSKYIASLNPISSSVQWRYQHLPPVCRCERTQEHITSSWKQKWSLGILPGPGFFSTKPFQADKSSTPLALSILCPCLLPLSPSLEGYPEPVSLMA